MKYRKSEERGLAPEGEYLLHVLDCIEQTSQNGNPMFVVKAAIAEGKYEGMWIWEYIVESAGWKLKQFAESVGVSLPAEGDDVSAAYFIDMEGRAQIKHKRRPQGDMGMKVEKWIARGSKPSPAPKSNAPTPEPDDDEIDPEEVPF